MVVMTERWIENIRKHGESDLAVDAFLQEIIAVCRRHQMCIEHEDHEGAFRIEPMDENSLDWLAEAHDGVTK